MKNRTASVYRKTRETDITVNINLDGTGTHSIKTGMPFMDHMLELLSVHSLVDVRITAKGDLQVDYHHTVEDIGITLGEAFDRALGTRKGIRRYGSISLPMDEALSSVSVDVGGRPYFYMRMACRKKKILDFDLSLFREFFQGFVTKSKMNIHIQQHYGDEAHHAYECVFKALARALREACEKDPRRSGIPSSKGKI